VTTIAPAVGLVDAVEPDTLAVDVLTVVADNVESEIVFDAGLNVRPVSEETATPLPPFTGENKIKCVAFVDAATVLIFSAVVAIPEVPLEVVIGTQDITPAEVDCRTELPVAGEDDGNIYTVLPDAEETKAV
jgi:hypothetical protein